MPQAPPGPYKYPNRSAFRANGTVMIDTGNLCVNANRVNVGRISAYGDPTSSVPPITTLGIHSPYLYTHYLDAANVDQFRVAAVVANDQIQLVSNTVITAPLTVGKPFSWNPPPFSVLSTVPVRLNGGTLGNLYPLNGGQIRGYFPLGVPQPTNMPAAGTIINLNGGTISGIHGTLY